MMLDLSLFNTQKVTSMSYMFNNCSSLITLNLSSFNTENVIKMYNMFDGCSSLTSLNMSSFNADKANISGMFAGCKNLLNFICSDKKIVDKFKESKKKLLVIILLLNVIKYY